MRFLDIGNAEVFEPQKKCFDLGGNQYFMHSEKVIRID
jgi:hypothetical protein